MDDVLVRHRDTVLSAIPAIQINAASSTLNAIFTLALGRVQLRNAPPATTRFCLVNLTLYTGLFLVGNALI